MNSLDLRYELRKLAQAFANLPDKPTRKEVIALREKARELLAQEK